MNWLQSLWRRSRSDEPGPDHEQLPAFGTVAARPDLVNQADAHREAAHRPMLNAETLEALAALDPPLRRSLHTQFDLSSVASIICPVLLESGNAALLVVAGYQASDAVQEVLGLVGAKYSLSEPALIIVAPMILQGVVRGQITEATLRGRRQTVELDTKTSSARAFREFVEWGVRKGAADIHINALVRGAAPAQVRYTINNRYIVPERYANMPGETLQEVLSVAWQDIQGGTDSVFHADKEQQGQLQTTVDGQSIILRWAGLGTDRGAGVTLRILHPDALIGGRSFKQLGYLPDQVAAMERSLVAEGGAIILAGVVGSGKSTTIATMGAQLPSDRKLITLEDPVEYFIPNALQCTVARPLAGESSGAFAAKLRTVKRSGMHDLMIGEIRDAETGGAFIDIAGSGTNLIATTHTGRAWMVPDRLASEFIGVPRDFLATPGILKLLVYQALLPMLCEHCSIPFISLLDGGPDRNGRLRDGDYWFNYGERFARLYDISPTNLRIRDTKGCKCCRDEELPDQAGYQGLTVVAEMIEPAIDEQFLWLVQKGDSLALRNHVASQRAEPYESSDMTGKSAMECAVYKASIGHIDPRDIEPRFHAFETEELARRQNKQRLGTGLRSAA